MGEYLKRCGRSRATEDGIQLNCSKKSKLYSELQNDSCGGDAESPENALSPAESRTSGSCNYDGSWRRLGSSPDLKNVDWQSEGSGAEVSTSRNGIFREATPTSEFCGDSEQAIILMDTKKPVSPHPASPPTKISASAAKATPSAAEVEEFFAAAEKYAQEQFAQKYNYDIVKDVPLEGRYEWVRLHP